MRAFGERLRLWRRAGFTLELWDTHRPTGTGYLAHTDLAYRFSDRGRVIFQGTGFVPPLSVAVDSDECVAALLYWFCLRPGDVEDGYFEGYTPTQSEWLESDRAEELAAALAELEQRERDA